MTPEILSRSTFRERALDRDNETCVIPWCDAPADEAHHIIERSLWPDGGYYLANAASVCNPHHRAAEANTIPPHAFWRWLNIEEPPLPATTAFNRLETEAKDGEVVAPHVSTAGDLIAYDKWGEPFETPPWQDHRDYIKYQSTRHLPFSHSRDTDDTEFRSVESFIDVPAIVTMKLDGGNAMIVKDTENPVRARNAKYADHQSFDLFKQLYWEKDLYSILPEYIQVFGEWMYAKHSIHYGCDGCCDDRNQGPPLDSYFYIFGVFDTRYNVWLSWPETVMWSEKLGFPTAPTVIEPDTPDTVLFETTNEFYDELVDTANRVVADGHEGLIIRRVYPFHYGDFKRSVGKYVRRNHVSTPDTHWSNKQIVENKVVSDG